MQRVLAVLLSISCCIVMSACSINAENNAAISDNMATSSTVTAANTPTASPDIIRESTPTASPATIIDDTATNTSDVSDNSENNLAIIYGKWKIVEQTGSGYIYGEFSMDDYVGGIITIDKDYIESDIPLEKTRLENPKYEIKEQSRNDFYMIIHSDYDSFGFEDDTPTMVEVYGENDTWDEFGGEFWIKDKNHLIFLGPVFFLAEKVE